MSIRMVEDLGAPIAVSAVNILTKEVAPDWNEWAHYAMTGAGYLGGFMKFGGDFVKQIGVASLSGTLDHVYNRVKGGATRKVAGGRLAFRPAAYAGIRQTVVPEFENVRVS